MLEYQKLILKKVSFSKDLFKKELAKSYKWLNSTDFYNLIYWASKQFGNIYYDIIYNISNKYAFNYKPDMIKAIGQNNNIALNNRKTSD